MVACTMAQQLGVQLESAAAPSQHAVSTRPSSECVPRWSELNPDSAVLSIERICAHDQISRAAMSDGLHTHCGTVPFVRMFYGSPSTYVREHRRSGTFG